MENDTFVLRIKKLSPLAFFVLPWIAVFILWRLNLTKWTDTNQIYSAFLVLGSCVGGPLIGSLTYHVVFLGRKKRANILFIIKNVCLCRAYRYRNNALILFLMIFAVEILLFGYIPIIRSLKGGSFNYFEFGIPGLHGFFYALGTSIISLSYLLWSIDRKRMNYFVISIVVFTFILVISRKAFFMALIQILIISLLTDRNIFNFRKIIYFFVAIYLFGLVGDIRTGRDAILSLAGINFEYPTWLPSAFIWIYIYIITPFANLINVYETTNPSYSIAFLFGTLVPKFILSLLGIIDYKPGGSFENNWQITEAFNMATGYLAAVKSISLAGPIMYGAILAYLTMLFSNPKNIYSFLSYSAFITSAIFMIFNDNFTALNFISQVFVYMVMYYFSTSSFRLKKDIDND